MANNYYDTTGVLVLDEVTDVIKALFGPFELDATYPGTGEAYIAIMSEETDDSWDAVLEGLNELAKGLGLQVLDDAGELSESVDDVLWALAEHFNVAESEEVAAVIERTDFDEPARLDSLFMLAKAFDDGHGLKAIKTETAWHCSKPRLFEFGGSGDFTGLHVAVSNDSRKAVDVGVRMEAALVAGHTADASNVIYSEMTKLLAAIYDPAVRDAVRANVRQMMSA